MSQQTQSFIEHLSDRPWSDYTASDYSVEQWHAACLIHQHEGPPTSKNQCKLPIKTPNGAINRNAVHSAAAALAGARGGVNASSEEKASAATTLIRHYREMGEKPPPSLLNHSNVKEFIEHFGTRGMKWGVRNAQSGGSSKGKKSGGDRTKFQKSAKHLSDAELARRIKRIEMEKKYNELKKPEVSKGKKAAGEVLGHSGKTIAKTVLVGVGTLAIAALIAKKNPAMSKALTKVDMEAIKKGAKGATKVAAGGAKVASELGRASPGGYL